MLSSIRRPKRLIIRGDDEKDHMFLVKGGEDLRLDQRVEQVSVAWDMRGSRSVFGCLTKI